MVFIALALWLVVSFLIAVPVSLFFRRRDEARAAEDEVIDPAELNESMARHPTRRTKVA